MNRQSALNLQTEEWIQGPVWPSVLVQTANVNLSRYSWKLYTGEKKNETNFYPAISGTSVCKLNHFYLQVHSFCKFCMFGLNLSLCLDQDLGPVVQSIVSLTSLLRGQLVKCFMTL